MELLTKHRPEVTFHDPRYDPKLKENAQHYVFQKKESETEEEINTKVTTIETEAICARTDEILTHSKIQSAPLTSEHK